MAAAMEAPKKPAAAYWIFVTESRESLAKELGTGKGSEVSKLAGKKWALMSAEQKEPYEKRSATNKAEYAVALDKFKAATEAVKEEAKRKREETTQEAGGDAPPQKMAKVAVVPAAVAPAATPKPKKPLTAYFAWVNANRAVIAKEIGTGNASAVGKAAGKRWKALDAESKAKFEAQQAEALVVYHATCAALAQGGGAAATAVGGA